jgi:hypothetical protein
MYMTLDMVLVKTNALDYYYVTGKEAWSSKLRFWLSTHTHDDEYRGPKIMEEYGGASTRGSTPSGACNSTWSWEWYIVCVYVSMWRRRRCRVYIHLKPLPASHQITMIHFSVPFWCIYVRIHVCDCKFCLMWKLLTFVACHVRLSRYDNTRCCDRQASCMHYFVYEDENTCALTYRRRIWIVQYLHAILWAMCLRFCVNVCLCPWNLCACAHHANPHIHAHIRTRTHNASRDLCPIAVSSS